MLTEPVPIESYVYRKLQEKKVQEIVSQWRIDPAAIFKLTIDHCRELGFYTVTQSTEKVIFKSILQHLKHSPELANMVRAAEKEEFAKRKARHDSSL